MARASPAAHLPGRLDVGEMVLRDPRSAELLQIAAGQVPVDLNTCLLAQRALRKISFALILNDIERAVDEWLATQRRRP